MPRAVPALVVLTVLVLAPAGDAHKGITSKFTYNADVLPLGQSDGNGFEFTGIFAEEAPWAMYGQRDGYKSGIAFSPTNAFGYTRAAIEALSMKIRDLEEKLALVA